MLHPIPESLALSATHPHNQLIAALKRIILSSRAPILAILHLTAPLLHALPAIRAACDTYATWLHLEGPALLHHFQQDFLLSFAHSALFEPAFLFHISAPCVFFGHESISQTLVSHPSHIFANSISLTFVCNAYNLSKRISLIHTLSSYTQSIPHILTPTSPVHATSPPLTLHSTSQTSLSHFLHISFPNLFSPSVHALHPVEAAFRLDNPYLPPRFLSRLCVGAVRAVLTARIVDAGGAAFVARLAASPHVRVEQAEGEVWGRVMIAPVGVVAGDVQAWGEGMRRVVALATKGLGAGIRFMVRREVGEDCLSVFVVPRLGGEEEGEGEGEEEEEDVDVVARQVLELSRQWDVSDEVARDFAIAAAEEVVDMVDCIVERLVVEEEDEDDEEEEIRKEGVMQSQVSSSALSSASIEEEKHVEGQVEEQQIVEQPSHNALLTVPSSPTLSESVNMPPIHTNTSTSVPDEPLPRDAQREELFSRHSNSTVSAVPEKVTQAPYRMQRFWTFVFGKDQSDDSSVEQNHIDHDSEEDEIEECKQDMELLEDHFRP